MSRVETFNRTEVIASAMDVFWQNGYNGTSIQDLVDATGLNRSSLYNSFGSKFQLYQDTLRQYEADTDRIFQLALVKSNNPLEAIRKIFESSVGLIKSDNEGKGCFILNCKSELGNSENSLTNWLIGNQNKSINLFQGLVVEGQRQKLIKSSVSPKILAYSLFNSFQGLRMTGILESDPKILDEIIDNTIRNIQ